MLNILEMGMKEILDFKPTDIKRILIEQEIFHIFKVLNALWLYDYDALGEGRPGLHAELKSGRCSDGFLFSKIVLKHPNLRFIMAYQLVMRFNQLGIEKPKFVAGIPNGATNLGIDIANIMEIPVAEMIKEDGIIRMVTTFQPKDTILLVEDFCTRGTGFKESVKDIKLKQPEIIIIPFELVIINRGGLKKIQVDDSQFTILAAATHRINDWVPEECPLCKKGSKRIKPKAIDENWEIIMASQKK